MVGDQSYDYEDNSSNNNSNILNLNGSVGKSYSQDNQIHMFYPINDP